MLRISNQTLLYVLTGLVCLDYRLLNLWVCLRIPYAYFLPFESSVALTTCETKNVNSTASKKHWRYISAKKLLLLVDLMQWRCRVLIWMKIEDTRRAFGLVHLTQSPAGGGIGEQAKVAAAATGQVPSPEGQGCDRHFDEGLPRVWPEGKARCLGHAIVIVADGIDA